MVFGYVVYKITFPNGKIYIGKDEGGKGHSLQYFGSWDAESVEMDFSKEELSDFTLRKEILFETSGKDEVRSMEGVFIRQFQSNNPEIGYNRTHRKGCDFS
ncbi:GIY-YIG nuclease family protein [Aquitalea sp. LB_tupeE]|uniref:GIY-YIG nuclease family protein n=1 Tax=Aquitalea sp. LB_tupeE TaxID=2748078 RepID=UPI0015BD7768|nr:GIY-YIG nuclease family protein [Aquitalea sp. LB_tupeE]NWK79797.1 GIY-YIG nuclease family protein [Aquitalea sp. LB_tupeE]